MSHFFGKPAQGKATVLTNNALPYTPARPGEPEPYLGDAGKVVYPGDAGPTPPAQVNAEQTASANSIAGQLARKRRAASVLNAQTGSEAKLGVA